MAAINQIKVRRQERAKAFSAVPRNRKTAALLGAVERKRPDNQVTAALERLLEPFDIGQLFVLAGQEVKGGAIMPDVI